MSESNNEEKPTDDVYRRFAEDRSHRDSAASMEYTKLLIQMVVGGNGLASTTLLTLAGVMKEKTALIGLVALPCASYLVGVVLGVVAAFKFADAQRTYADAWLFCARGDHAREKACQIKGWEDYSNGKRSIFNSTVAFVVGNMLAILFLFAGSKMM